MKRPTEKKPCQKEDIITATRLDCNEAPENVPNPSQLLRILSEWQKSAHNYGKIDHRFKAEVRVQVSYPS